MNSRLTKSVAAVFAAPMVAGCVVGLILAMGENSEEGRRVAMAAALLGAIAFGIPGTAIIGLPVHGLLLAMRWTRWWSYAIAGSACGFLYEVWILLRLCVHASADPAICPVQTTHMVAYTTTSSLLMTASTVTAVCGWLIRRPDRDRVSMASTNPQRPN
jgi:hypothetical protein